MTAAQKILLAQGLAALVVAVWGLAAPAALRRAGAVSWKAVSRVNTLLGAGLLTAALALWAVVLIGQPLVHLMLALIGLALAWFGMTLFRRQSLESLGRRMAAWQSAAAIRVLCAATAAAAVFAIGVAVLKR